jgi:RND superfamily putative drug exporter
VVASPARWCYRHRVITVLLWLAVLVGPGGASRALGSAYSDSTIMVVVFLSFVLQGQRVIAEFGIGLAAAVLLDAFIIRSVLVPSPMHLFGRANWWLPGRLDRRLPHLAVEPLEDAQAVAEPELVPTVR